MLIFSICQGGISKEGSRETSLSLALTFQPTSLLGTSLPGKHFTAEIGSTLTLQ